MSEAVEGPKFMLYYELSLIADSDTNNVSSLVPVIDEDPFMRNALVFFAARKKNLPVESVQDTKRAVSLVGYDEVFKIAAAVDLLKYFAGKQVNMSEFDITRYLPQDLLRHATDIKEYLLNL